MATHSSVLAWRIPGTGEPCGLPSMGSHRVRHDLAAAAAVAFLTMHSSFFCCFMQWFFFFLAILLALPFPCFFLMSLSLSLSIFIYPINMGSRPKISFLCRKDSALEGSFSQLVLRDSNALEKEMATHSSILAQTIPGTGEPGGLPSMGSHRVRHN